MPWAASFWREVPLLQCLSIPRMQHPTREQRLFPWKLGAYVHILLCFQSAEKEFEFVNGLRRCHRALVQNTLCGSQQKDHNVAHLVMMQAPELENKTWQAKCNALLRTSDFIVLNNNTCFHVTCKCQPLTKSQSRRSCSILRSVLNVYSNWPVPLTIMSHHKTLYLNSVFTLRIWNTVESKSEIRKAR